MFIPHRRKGYKVPIIFEFGSMNLRAGFAGKDSPDVVVPSEYLMDSEGNLKYLDYDSFSQPEGFEVKSFLQNGVIQVLFIYKAIYLSIFYPKDVDICREFIDHITTDYLRAEKDSPFFMVESMNTKRENRYKLIEMLFEDFSFSSVFFYRSSLLAQYIVARETALVVDSGAYSTCVVPIIDGQVVEKAIIKSDFGGENLTEILMSKWQQQHQKLSRYSNYDILTPSVQKWGDREIVRDAKHQLCKLYDTQISNLKFNQAVDNSVYELPDKNKLEISKEMYEVPELLFVKNVIICFQNFTYISKPDINFEGIDRMIEMCLEKVDNDYKKELIQNIILIGGTTATNNFFDRLQRSLGLLKLSGLSQKAKIFAPPKVFERQHAAWIAASIVASAPIFDSRTLTRADFEEHGSALIEKKMFY